MIIYHLKVILYSEYTKNSKIFWMLIGIHKIYLVSDLCWVKNPSKVKSFGIHLRKLREERKWSQQELADMANLAKTTVQRIENAKFTVSLDVLFSLSDAFQISLKEMMDFPFYE
jgi:DNA-binding XRE family transcriptional regulator